MTVNKDKTYNKYKDGKQADFIFNYLLTEYHVQPEEFLYYEGAEDILRAATKESDREYAKGIVDDFFCDYYKSKRKMWSYIESCTK